MDPRPALDHRHGLFVLVLIPVLLPASSCSADEGRDCGDLTQETAEEVDETPYETHAEEADAIRKLLQIEPGDTVADVGAGDGDWTENLAGFFGESGTV